MIRTLSDNTAERPTLLRIIQSQEASAKSCYSIGSAIRFFIDEVNAMTNHTETKHSLTGPEMTINLDSQLSSGDTPFAEANDKQAGSVGMGLPALASSLATAGLIFKPAPDQIRVSGDGRTLAALAHILDRAAVGKFGEWTNPDTGETCYLNIPFSTMRTAEPLLAHLTSDDLESAAADVAKEKRKADESEAARIRHEQDTQSLTPQKLAGKLATASGGRFELSWTADGLSIEVPKLLPVTHFKALARLAYYDGKTHRFTPSRNDVADLTWRLRMLTLAEKIGKSTKVVTAEDIVSRRKRMQDKKQTKKQTHKLEMDFWEAREDFGELQARTWLHEGRLIDTVADVRASEGY